MLGTHCGIPPAAFRACPAATGHCPAYVRPYSGENPVLDQDQGRWLTYAEAGELLGISADAARLRARRQGWSRRTPNKHGATARVLVARPSACAAVVARVVQVKAG